ncbi:MAG: HD domain-containing protein [Pseudomonadota bacterium]|nr:HD domain-containing protein [Pseudomonadota bacterium]
MTRPDLGQVGLAAIDQGSPQRLGVDLVAVFRLIEPMPDKVQWVCREISRRLGVESDPALDRAWHELGALIDADPHTFDRHPYHNRQHYCEVALAAYFLGVLDRARLADVQLVLLAALVHDLVHDGRHQRAFELERASVERARPVLAAAGVAVPAIARIEALVLATDPSAGIPFMAQACRAHALGNAPPLPPSEAPELSALTDDPALAGLARLLCEADILPSIGLTFAHSMRLQQRLAAEWQRPLDPRDKLEFIDAVLAHGFLGAFFLPNVQAARQQLRELRHASAES